MPPSSFTPELKEILRKADCRFDRHGKGDHDIWFSPINQRKFTVDGKIKSRHTANAVLKQAGLKKQF
ncbi:MAG: type II toxin-antitoxin system HicA family toxin [Pseudomonadales bacterium]